MPDTPRPKQPEEVKEERVSEWKPISEEQLTENFCGGGDPDKTDWSALDFCQARNYEWYQQRFPGFPEEILRILVKCDGTYQDPEKNMNEWERRQQIRNAVELRKEKTTVFFD